MSEPLVDGIRVHSKRFCEPPCPFHAPSDHPLKDAPMHLRMDKGGLVERICEHGVGHDDPDSAAYMRKHGQGWAGIHGCDGCCTTKNSPEGESLAKRQVASSIVTPDTKNSPKEESLGLTGIPAKADSSTIPDLRAELEKIINWTVYRAKENPVSIDKAINRIMQLIAAQNSALLDKVEGLIGEDELIVGPTHESVLYRNNLKAELRAEIAKLRKGGA